MMLRVFTFWRAKNTSETYLHFITTEMYKSLYKMQYHLKKNKFCKVLAVRKLNLYFLKRYHFRD